MSNPLHKKLIDNILSGNMVKAKEQFKSAISEKVVSLLDTKRKQVAQRMFEETMTDDEKAEKEIIVKGMKKNKKDFEDRYGEDAESVMHATATKMAMGESVESDLYGRGKVLAIESDIYTVQFKHGVEEIFEADLTKISK